MDKTFIDKGNKMMSFVKENTTEPMKNGRYRFATPFGTVEIEPTTDGNVKLHSNKEEAIVELQKIYSLKEAK